MNQAANGRRGDKLTIVLLLVYFVASSLHFFHNAEQLHAYPNFPQWISRASVYGTWIAISAVGALGCLLYLRGHVAIGLTLLVPYAAAGFGGLLHYTRAPFGAHSASMNFTIMLEAGVALVLMVRLVALAKRCRAKSMQVLGEP